MAEMTTAGGTCNLCALHTPRVVFMTGYSTGNGCIAESSTSVPPIPAIKGCSTIVECRPSTAALEFRSRSVQRCTTSSTRIYTFCRVMLVVFSFERSLCAFLAENLELNRIIGQQG